MEKWDWIVDVFAFIGMIVCILIALIAIVWVTCFAVKLLIKTFNVKVGKSFELMSEDISKKAEAKRERNEIKRKAATEQKLELLNLKLENKQKIHEMKKQKLTDSLKEKENAAKQKIFGEKFEIDENEYNDDEIEQTNIAENRVNEESLNSEISENEEKVLKSKKTTKKQKK